MFESLISTFLVQDNLARSKETEPEGRGRGVGVAQNRFDQTESVTL